MSNHFAKHSFCFSAVKKAAETSPLVGREPDLCSSYSLIIATVYLFLFHTDFDFADFHATCFGVALGSDLVRLLKLDYFQWLKWNSL